jgi:hypothetical protein
MLGAAMQLFLLILVTMFAFAAIYLAHSPLRNTGTRVPSARTPSISVSGPVQPADRPHSRVPGQR